ncbi:cytoplasmic dynein 2 intermediate chain 1 isoform X2 [Heterodontus francisci]|uniref:cytoplasmic dynein 2 intermediate chain 1 isoform X2 n=1 Tax=Heterodontus francisci TaxID=7792 RepID=UPI00355BF81A
MKSSKVKTKEDTWKADELLKHIKAAQGDHTDDNSKKSREKKKRKDEESTGSSDSREHRHRGRERDKERERDKDRVRNKGKERDGDRHKEREHEKVQKKVKHEERDREKKQEKERERHKDRDRDKEKSRKQSIDLECSADPRVCDRDKRKDTNAERPTKRGHESERHRDRKKERDKLQEKGIEKDENGEPRSKHRQKKEKENLELAMDDKYEGKERKHKEQKEKDGRSAENNEETKEKKRSSEFRNEDRDRRYKERKEHGLHDAHHEKRQKERKEPVQEVRVEEADKKHRERKDKEFKEHGKKQRSKDIKDPVLERRDREREHKDREKRDRERTEDRERKHKHKVKKGREEKGRQGDYEEQSSKRKKEQRSVQEVTSESRRKGTTAEQIDSQKKPTEALSEEFVEGEEITMESQSTIESSNYEDDFEDYEDDFEEAEYEDEQIEQEREEIPARQRAEIEAIQKAIQAENEQISVTRLSHRKTYDEEPKSDFENSQTRGPARGTFIDFVAAKQREIGSKVASKQKKRCVELLRLIDLDFSVSFSMLDLPPLNEYDVYIKNFGRTNTKQAFVQCNEDNVDRDIQTDEIETVEKWTQHPGEGNIVCGGANVSDALSSDSVAKNVDSRRLTNFLKSACQVIAVLLEEDQAENQASKNVQSQAASLSVSDGCSQLNTNVPFLHGREVLCLHFSQVQRQTLLSVHSLPKEPGVVQLASNYMICVWNIWEPSAPQKVLVCESEVQCCCFGPGNVVSVFAGTVDGSVVAWDLREHSIIHYTLQNGGQEWTLRTPTFSTDGVLTTVNHSCAVKAVYPVSSACFDNHGVGLSLFSSHDGSSGLSFQLASLDESGLLNLWVVVELQKADLAGSLTDLGLIPGGKMKLIHSSSIDVNSFFPRNLMQLGPPQTLSIRFLPSDPNHFFIGTDIGLVSHGTRHGLQAAPKLYKSQINGARPVQVTCIDFCHFGKKLFLVGCSDGTIRLHSVTTECPIIQWNESTQGRPIRALLWALTRPGMFFVLDASSHIYVWDLLQNDSKPVAEESLQPDRITAIAILGDPEKPSASSGLMLAKQSGAIEIQYLKKQWSEPHLNELETLHYILQKTA